GTLPSHNNNAWGCPPRTCSSRTLCRPPSMAACPSVRDVSHRHLRLRPACPEWKPRRRPECLRLRFQLRQCLRRPLTLATPAAVVAHLGSAFTRFPPPADTSTTLSLAPCSACATTTVST